ncbi:hypothetical protein D3C85_1118720 [compost metagenome]
MQRPAHGFLEDVDALMIELRRGVDGGRGSRRAGPHRLRHIRVDQAQHAAGQRIGPEPMNAIGTCQFRSDRQVLVDHALTDLLQTAQLRPHGIRDCQKALGRKPLIAGIRADRGHTQADAVGSIDQKDRGGGVIGRRPVGAIEISQITAQVRQPAARRGAIQGIFACQRERHFRGGILPLEELHAKAFLYRGGAQGNRGRDVFGGKGGALRA